MNLHDAEDLARKLMTEWLPPHWTFQWANTKRVLGRCTYDTCTIELSRSRTQTRTRAQVEDVIRHEIAHALAGPDAGHGPAWRNMARHVGANPSRTTSDTDGDGRIEDVYKWVATCGTCGKKTGKHRQSKDMISGNWACGDCCRAHNGGGYDVRFVLTFVRQW